MSTLEDVQKLIDASTKDLIEQHEHIAKDLDNCRTGLKMGLTDYETDNRKAPMAIRIIIDYMSMASIEAELIDRLEAAAFKDVKHPLTKFIMDEDYLNPVDRIMGNSGPTSIIMGILAEMQAEHNEAENGQG